MIYFEVKNSSEKTLASNIDTCPILSSFLGFEKESKRVRKFRNIYRENAAGSVRLIIIDDADLYHSNRMVNKIIDVYFELLPQFKEIEKHQRQYFNSIIQRFAHNLITVQSKLKGHLQRLASDNARENSYSDFSQAVHQRIINNTESAANDISQVSHRVADLDAQIDGLRVISGFAETTKLSLVNANIRKTLLRLHHPFVQEFEKKGVNIQFSIDSELSNKNKIRIDPQLFNVAMWHFFDNAVKYVHPKTNINFTANLEGQKKILNCEMTSLQIEEDERQKIFEERYKGRNAKNVVGDGIGMFMVRRALSLMSASAYVTPDYSTSEIVDDKKYCKNIFTFEFQPI